MTPLISIIIPAYNVESLLSNTLDSILAQTYKKIEVIVVNDGSQDRTGDVIDQYAKTDSRVRAIHKENGGVTSARLRGVHEASGEWIGFVDGDDFVEPQMYARLIENALKYKVDISHCGYQMVFPNRTDYYYNSGEIIHQDRTNALLDLLSGVKVEPGMCNKLYNKKLFQNLSIDYSIKNNEDLLMNYWLFKAASSSVFEDICPYHYVVRSGSAANSAINEHLLWDPLRVAKILEKDSSQDLHKVAFPRLVRLLISGASRSHRENSELILPYKKNAQKELRERIPSILFGNECSLKLKIMALWTAIWPWSYGWIHRIYARLSGIDKKYDLR